MVEEKTEADSDSEGVRGSLQSISIADQLKAGVEEFRNTGRTTWLRRAGFSGLLAYVTTTTPVLGQLADGIELVCSTPLGQAFNVFFGLIMLGCVLHSFAHVGIGFIKLRPGGGGMQGQSEGRGMLMSGAASFCGFLLLLGYPAILTYFGQSLTGCVGF